MNEHDCQKCEYKPVETSERRKFLRGAAAAAGGLVLGMQIARAQVENAQVENGEQAAPAPLPETFLALPPAVLENVGGFQVVENGDDKIIVARIGPTTIVACSAICPHKGGILDYDHASGQFVCPEHKARFETSGKVVKGPAKVDLKSYQTRAVLGLSADVEQAK